MRRSGRRHDLTRVARIAAALVALLQAIALTLAAQELPGRYQDHEGAIPLRSKAHALSHPAAEPRYIGPHPFDILHYRLDLSFAMTTEAMGGRVEITMVLKEPLDSLVLNQAILALDTVQVNGVEKAFSKDDLLETFTVRLDTTRNAGDTLRLAVSYRRVPGIARPSFRRGYYYFNTQEVIGLPANLGYTMSEPSDARFWLPCFDDPSEKGTAEIHAAVPTGYVAASNGKLLGVTDNGNGTSTWHWKEDHQITPYLMCVTISEWAVSTLPYVRAVNDTVPVQYYVFRPDSARAAAYLPTVAEMVEVFSGLFGPYPFDKYGMTGVTPFNFGGMEHQSITTLHRAIQTEEGVVSHELAHQWWGDLVTCGTWADIWLNESFATYSEGLWHEHVGGSAGLREYMRGLEHFYFNSWAGAIYDPEGQGYNLFADLVYSKGAWVMHTLRGVLGDSLFFRVLRAYREKYEGGSAVTEEFRAVVDSVSGTSFGWFFDQWIYKPGWPVYALHHSWGADTLTLRIFQQQSSPRPVYTMPIQARFYHGNSDTTITVQNYLARQTYRIPLSFNPDSVKLDPDNWILKQVAMAPVSVVEEPVPLTFALDQNYPNPFNPRTVIRSQMSEARHVKLAVCDLLGREVAVLVNERRAAGRYQDAFDGTGLASGVYLYRLTAGSFTATKIMLLLR